jgi:hypothetical protein
MNVIKRRQILFFIALLLQPVLKFSELSFEDRQAHIRVQLCNLNVNIVSKSY